MQLDLQRKLGSLFMIGIPGHELDRETVKLIETWGVSNFIIFKRNADKGAKTLSKLCSELKLCCNEAGLDAPLIAVDQEGGAVQRLGAPFWEEIPSNAAVSASLQPEVQVAKQASLASMMLKDVGINLNLAPCLDLAGADTSGVLASRSYGLDAVKTARIGSIYVQTLQNQGILACAKHFPGIGRVQSDPHFELPGIHADQPTIEREMQPFCAAIKTGVAFIMTSHVIFHAIDGKPATFSHEIVKLARSFGFEGVIITDDLEMAGATASEDTSRAALRAFEAGHDLLLICHKQHFVWDALERLEHGVKQEGNCLTRLKESVTRIASAKRSSYAA